MPTLRKYVDGSGYFLADCLQGVGYCTWQIGDEGIAYLSERGIKLHGDRLTGRDRNELKSRNWIWITGTNPNRLPTGAIVLPAELRPLAEALSKWAKRGRLEDLGSVLYVDTGDQRDRCFSQPFLKWLSSLDPCLHLADFDEISATDFEDVATSSLDRLCDPLHSFFARRGETHVLWQLARLIGVVARQRRGGSTCPVQWQAHHRVLERLFAQVGSFETTETTDPRGSAPRRRNRRGMTHPPRIIWEVELQQVVAILPDQTLPDAVHDVAWHVTPGEAPQPQTWRHGESLRVEAARSSPLGPTASYTIETELRGELSIPPITSRIDLPPKLEPCVLFTTEGTMLRVDAEGALPPGDYLALVRQERIATLFDRAGVHQIEPVDIAPVGWHGWKGCRLRLAPAADVAPYIVGADGPSATWELEAALEAGVRWREALPVHVGRWPKLFISSPPDFTGAAVHVAREPATQADHVFVVAPGGDVAVHDRDGRFFVDLNDVAELADHYGTLCLTCRPPSQPDGAPLTARLVRLPDLSLRYIPDPAFPERALAVRLQGKAEVLSDLKSEEHTDVLYDADGVVLRAIAPHVSPGVSAKMARYAAAIRVRVPVTRLGVVREGAGFLGWQAPPICDLDLSIVEVGDRLRIELHEQPALEDDRLLCRVVGGEEITAGHLISSRGPVWQFEVELHRWRDALSYRAGGSVQVRTSARWVDIVRLEPQLPTAPVVVAEKQPEGKRARLVADLERAVDGEGRAELRRVADECFAYINQPGASAVDRELLLLATARGFSSATPEDLIEADRCLDELGDRADLPEVAILRRTIGLRLASHSAAVRSLSADQVEELISELRDIPEAALFRAECWYQFARRASGPASGGWRSSFQLANDFLRYSVVRTQDRRIATLLRDIGRLMLALEPDSAPPLLPAPNPIDTWITAVHLISQSLRTPHFRSVRSSLLDRSVPDTSVLCPEDATLVRIAISHAAGGPADENDFAKLSAWGPGKFFGMTLLRARQARFRGNDKEAEALYNQVCAEALAGGPDFLLDVEAAEGST